MPDKIPFGLKNNQLVHVDDVPNGLDCGCTCPECGAPLIARNGGKKVAHHFAHASGPDCENAYETTIHLFAKDIIAKSKKIFIPNVRVNMNGAYKQGLDSDFMESAWLVSEGRFYDVDEVLLEKKFRNFIPDIFVHIKKTSLIIEVLVTHEVEQEKAEKIKASGISAIEIDLSNIPRNVKKEDLQRLVLQNAPRYWLHNAKAERIYNDLRTIAEMRQLRNGAFGWRELYCRNNQMIPGTEYTGFKQI